MSRPAPVSAPSSLLPTKTAPSTSCRNRAGKEDAGVAATQRSKGSFIGRSLRSLRLRSQLSPASASVLASPAYATKQRGLDDAASTPHAWIAHLQPSTSTRTSAPRPLFRPEPAIPDGAAPPCPPGSRSLALGVHARTASGAPVWPGLGAREVPSPAPTEEEAHTPDGLLNPQWVNGDGMRSQGVISFRDDMDYSRPIGGVSTFRCCTIGLELELTITPCVAGGEQAAVQQRERRDGVVGELAALRLPRVSPRGWRVCVRYAHTIR